MVVDEVVVREGEIASHPPFFAPGVAHNEAALCLVVTHREDSVSASDLLVANRHRSATSVRDLVRMEAVVNSEPENEWITGGKASFHLRTRPPHAMVSQGGMFCCFDVTFSPRLLAKLADPIRP